MLHAIRLLLLHRYLLRQYSPEQLLKSFKDFLRGQLINLMQVVLLLRTQFSVLTLDFVFNLGSGLVTLFSQVGVVVFRLVSCLVVLGDM